MLSDFPPLSFQSPIDFLNHYRLEVSCHLLNNTKLSIAEICTHAASIIRVTIPKIFLRTYHCTPEISENAQQKGLPTLTLIFSVEAGDVIWLKKEDFLLDIFPIPVIIKLQRCCAKPHQNTIFSIYFTRRMTW